MKRYAAFALAAFALAACGDSDLLAPTSGPIAHTAVLAAEPSGHVTVSNSNNAGPGSFRDAISQANANPAIHTIAFQSRVNRINIQSGVTFSGPQSLTIDGHRATLNGAAAGGTAFLATGGGNLTIKNLTVRDAPGEGIHVEVPGGATGTLKVSLVGVDIIGNKGHGVLINDQDDPSTTDGVQPVATGSAASLDVSVFGSRFDGNGYSVSDRDGLRVNEGGDGDLTFTFKLSRAEDNAADGVEIDERGAGNVRIDIAGASFTRNGKFDPADLDDGFDIDEYDDGSILGTVSLSSASNNFEEGFDFNENNAGDLRVDLTLVAANGNGEEGIDLEEDDDFGGGGDLVTVMNGITTIGNGDGADGALKIREKEDGNLTATLSNILSVNNTGSGIFIRESQGGSSVVNIERAISNASTKGVLDPFSLGHGIELLESGAGDLTGTVRNSSVSANAGNGVFADETGAGVGVVTLIGIVGGGNALGQTGGTAVVP